MSGSASAGSKSKRICCFELSEQEQNDSKTMGYALGFPDVRKRADERAHAEDINNRASFMGAIDDFWKHPCDCGAAEKWTQRRGQGSCIAD